MIPTKAQLEQAVADGLTQQQAGDRFGCHKDTVTRYAKRYGVAWPHRARFSAEIGVEIDGRRMTLREAADENGIDRTTMYWRHKHGWRGRDLIDPPRHNSQAPPHYEVGYTRDEWREIVAYASARTINAASKMFGVPYGAITAAMRGEDERLG